MGKVSSSIADGTPQNERALLETIPLFASLDDDELSSVHDRCSRVRIAAGDWLVREGDGAEALFVVVHGRLEAVGPGATDKAMSRGHVIGEIGMLTGQARSVGVRALRDSELLALSKEEFDNLADAHPAWLRQAAQIVVDRLTSANQQPEPERVLTITMFRLDDALGSSEAVHGVVEMLTAAAPTIWRSANDAPPVEERARWSHELEGGYRYVLFDAGSGDEAWKRWCLRQSDRMVLVAAADRPPTTLPPVVAGEIARRDGGVDVVLVLSHPAWAARPRDVVGWLDAIRPRSHLHVRRGNQADIARVARIVTDRGIGLVLGGGASRGFVHLGALDALEETGIPVDAVGGTSVGAIVGALKAIDLGSDGRKRLADEFVGSVNVLVPTLPILSFSSARRIRQLLESHEYFDDLLIEECWLPFFSISANLTRAAPVVHEHGSLATAVRASLSLPGVFPPVRQGQDFLVDGGVLNNLPVDVMRNRLRGGSVIAVDLSVAVEVGAPSDYRETPSGWSLLADRLRGRERQALPLAIGVLVRAKDLAAIRAQREILANHAPDVLIHPQIAGYGMFDFKGAQGLMDVGYHETISQLEGAGWISGA